MVSSEPTTSPGSEGWLTYWIVVYVTPRGPARAHLGSHVQRDAGYLHQVRARSDNCVSAADEPSSSSTS